MRSEHVQYSPTGTAGTGSGHGVDKHRPESPRAPPGLGVRHVQALMLFMSLTIGYAMRAQLSVSMVAMTGASNGTGGTGGAEMHNQRLPHNNVTGADETSASVGADESSSWSVYRRYSWDKPTQELVLFSFFVGYTGMMLPMGMLGQRYGGKIPIMVALGTNGVVSILTPWMPIFGGWVAVGACRLLQGMTQAAFYPSIHTMLGQWAPRAERARLSTYVYTGSQLGTVVGFQVGGLCAGSAALGWPATFWASGGASLACCAMLGVLGAASPREHRTISAAELEYITGDARRGLKHKPSRTPWGAILRSAAVWGLVAGHAGSALGYLFVLTQVPFYMDKILGVDIKHNGVYSSLPYIAMYFMTLAFGQWADYCHNRKLLSIANIRRVANTIGMVVSGAFLAAFSLVQSTAAGVGLLVLCLALHSGVHVGFNINQIDLAPNFAGPIMALGNMVANLASLVVPVMVSTVVGHDVTNQRRWQVLFCGVAGVQVLTNAVFVVLVRGEVQPWNTLPGDDAEKEEAVALQVKRGGGGAARP